jgi:hypothetical protein
MHSGLSRFRWWREYENRGSRSSSRNWPPECRLTLGNLVSFPTQRSSISITKILIVKLTFFSFIFSHGDGPRHTGAESEHQNLHGTHASIIRIHSKATASPARFWNTASQRSLAIPTRIYQHWARHLWAISLFYAGCIELDTAIPTFSSSFSLLRWMHNRNESLHSVDVKPVKSSVRFAHVTAGVLLEHMRIRSALSVKIPRDGDGKEKLLIRYGKEEKRPKGFHASNYDKPFPSCCLASVITAIFPTIVFQTVGPCSLALWVATDRKFPSCPSTFLANALVAVVLKPPKSYWRLSAISGEQVAWGHVAYSHATLTGDACSQGCCLDRSLSWECNRRSLTSRVCALPERLKKTFLTFVWFTALVSSSSRRIPSGYGLIGHHYHIVWS